MKKTFTYLAVALFLVSCTEPAPIEIKKQNDVIVESLNVPSTIVEKSKLQYNTANSLWTLDNELFSGYAVSYLPDSTLIGKFGILDGKKQNVAMDWFPDGQMKQSAGYHKGKLHGEKINWSHEVPHIIISHLNYQSGKGHGVQKKWYNTGEIYKVMNLNMGKEEGMQKAYRKNGDLYTNYEAREGRFFGLRRASLCFGLENEEIQ